MLWRTDETLDGETNTSYWLSDRAENRLYRYDETQLAEAQIELDRLCSTGEGYERPSCEQPNENIS